MLVIDGVAAIHGRDRAMRILLLRPFGDRRMTRPLKRVVVRELGRLGLVFTLEDRSYRPHWFVTILMFVQGSARYILAPLLHPPLRIASIKNEWTFLKLANRLLKKLRPSFDSFVNGGQAFNIRSTNPWWQNVIEILMYSSDLVIMDVSRVHEGSKWEIDHLNACALVSRCIFIVQQEHLQEGQESIAHLLPSALRPELFAYDAKGVFLEEVKFRSLFEGAAGAAVHRWAKPLPGVGKTSAQPAV